MPLKPLLTVAALALSAAFAPALEAEMPKSFKNEYSTRIFGIKVTVTHELSDLKNEGQQLRFEADSWIGNIEEISQFHWNEGVVQPQKYFYKRRGLGRDRDAELTFDWEAERVTNDVQGKSWDMDIHKNVQDKLSYQVQLQKDMIAGKDNLVYPIADGGEMKVYRFEIVSEERLNTPMGPVDTVKVKRSRDDDDRATFAWLAPKWDYLLVRLEQREDGDSHTINIDKARINGKTIEAF
ncbi:DUF3108 domain-containing protein [Marinimicrobium locisalis]|uniref:DUF3108 domain-containing protein n=1 Tax=Marinimicrobium locisalis TaxID=546022 RepID=UPI003221D400